VPPCGPIDESEAEPCDVCTWPFGKPEPPCSGDGFGARASRQTALRVLRPRVEFCHGVVSFLRRARGLIRLR
jgi:hypothetical protein